MLLPFNSITRRHEIVFLLVPLIAAKVSHHLLQLRGWHALKSVSRFEEGLYMSSFEANEIARRTAIENTLLSYYVSYRLWQYELY